MANKAAGELDVQLDGKTYTLRPTFQAILEFEDKAGTTVFEALRAVSERQSVSLRSMAAAFHSCLKAAWRPSMGVPPVFEEVALAVRKDGVADHIGNYASVLTNMMTGERALSEAAKATTEGNG